MLKLIKHALANKANNAATTEQLLTEKWLSESIDLVDIERRQRMINKGQAPWQTRSNNNTWSW